MPARFTIFPLLCCIAISLNASSFAAAQSGEWSAFPREKSASLEIRWRKGESSGDWKSGPAEIKKGEAVTLQVKPIADSSIRWYQIVPDTRKFYKNANYPWEADAYKWVGFGKIDCLRREIVSWRGRWDVVHRTAPSEGTSTKNDLDWPEAGQFYHSDLGSFWFDVEVLKSGKILRSFGLADRTERGMNTRTFRLSVRQDDSQVGWLTSFFNVPGLFGCTPYQSSNYIGVDCADCMMAGWSKWKNKPLDKDWNVAGVVTSLPKVREFDIRQGMPTGEIRWTSHVRPVDFIAVRYPGRRQYQHIGALYKDANSDGKLDGGDLVIHAGPEALQVSPLNQGNFEGHIAIIRASER